MSPPTPSGGHSLGWWWSWTCGHIWPGVLCGLAKDVLTHRVAELMVLLQEHQGSLFKNADSL